MRYPGSTGDAPGHVLSMICAEGACRAARSVAAPEPADLSFHAAFFMGAVLAREAEERVEPVVGAQGDEPIALQPVTTFEDPGHRRLQVVVATRPGTPPKWSKA